MFGRTAVDFCGRCVRETGRWPSRVWMTKRPGCACGCENAAAGLNARLQLGDIVAERFAETAGFEKITLHVDDDERGLRQFDVDGMGSAVTRTMGLSPERFDEGP